MASIIFSRPFRYQEPFLLNNTSQDMIRGVREAAEAVTLKDGGFYLNGHELSARQVEYALSNVDRMIQQLFGNLPNHYLKNELLFTKKLLICIKENFVEYENNTDKKVHELSFQVFQTVNKIFRFSCTRPYCNTRPYPREIPLVKEIVRRFFILDSNGKKAKKWYRYFRKTLFSSGPDQLQQFFDKFNIWIQKMGYADFVDKEIAMEERMPVFLQNLFSIERSDFVRRQEEKFYRVQGLKAVPIRTKYGICNAGILAQFVYRLLRRRYKKDLVKVQGSGYPVVLVNNKNKTHLPPRGKSCWVIDAFQFQIYRAVRLPHKLKIPGGLRFCPERTKSLGEILAKSRPFNPNKDRLVVVKSSKSPL